MKTELVSVLHFFIIFAIFYEINCEWQGFEPIFEDCNATFPVSRDFIYIQDMDKMLMEMKQDRNKKCFDHCVLHKLNFVDDEGNIRKNDIFENAAKLLIEVPEYLREDMKISPEFKKLFLSYIEKCEQLDSTKKAIDACERMYEFVSCFKNVTIVE